MSDIWQSAELTSVSEETRTRSERLLDTLNAQQTRLFLWVPVCLMAGIAAYFALSVEPPTVVFIIVTGIALSCFWSARRSRWSAVFLVLALFQTGFVAAKIRTESVRTAQLSATTGTLRLAGWITDVSMSGANKAKVVIEIERLSKIRRDAWPHAVQLTLFKLRQPPRIGQYLQAKARLFPLITPVAPGAFDYGRTLWFKGIGATGRGVIAGENELAAPLPDRWSWQSTIADWRTEIGRRVHQAMPSDLAAFAEALITGNRSQIRKELRDQLSIAGLAHVLAISGLHMSLVAGGMFWLVRALLALVPGLTLTRPIKKYAAIAALVTGAGYLALSGGAISTQRAYIMLLVMFVAVLLDRPAISLRNLAVAATAILLFTPEAALSAGFQMSFLAVMGLIAVYETLRDTKNQRRQTIYPRTRHGMLARWIFRFFLATATTTLIASVFTGLPAAYHFNRIAPLGLIANVLALPIVTLVVMPMAVLATLLMPLGLEAWPLLLMGEGLGWVTSIAEWVTGLPYASIAVPTLPTISAVCLAAASLWLCLWRGRIRLWATVPTAIAVLLAFNVSKPDILIERAGKNVAIRGDHGNLVPATARRAKFVARKWLLNDGDDASLKEAAARQGWSCSKHHCRAVIKQQTVVFIREGAKNPSDCWQADVLISDFPLRGACQSVALRIDRFDLWRNGAYGITIDGTDTTVIHASQARGDRPWVTTPIARSKIQLVPTKYVKTVTAATN